ncbi:MAG: hypothetical protein H0W17_06135, partial [Chloroflexi bacterium]|nr:hypothetical protein [Chloroflexota bacterium]
MTDFHGRRLRRTPALRALVSETRLHPAMLVAPLFVRPGHGIREEIGSMPGQHRLSVDELPAHAARLLEAGVRSVLLFGLPESKDPDGSGAWADEGIVQQAIRELRRAVGDELAVIADVCLCEYTSHGHCGVLRGASIDNDATLPLLAAGIRVDHVPDEYLTVEIARGLGDVEGRRVVLARANAAT